MEDILSQAKEKGLFVVNSEDANETQILNDFQEVVSRTDLLCEKVDPEDKPFQSKYEARDTLDEFLKRLEATKAIATLEKKTDFVETLRKLIAVTQTRIGSISYDCEEPHNAQSELEAACNYYFPGVITSIDENIGNRDELLSSPDSSLNPAMEADAITAPDLPSLAKEVLFDAMKCLNLLGILWAGRGQPLKSLHYLLAANRCYSLHKEQAGADSTALEKDWENSFTHNLFYLAQAYGNLKSMRKSSQYCEQTLQRQLFFGLVDLKTALEWVKNCCGIADYYLAMRQYYSCSVALLSAEKVLKERVIHTLYQEMERQLQSVSLAQETEKPPKTNQRPNFVMGSLNAAEIEADLHRRLAILDVQLLKQASDRWRELQAAQSLGLDSAAIDEEYRNEEDEQRRRGLQRRGDREVSLFEELWVSELSPLRVTEINSFDSARQLFLRAAARIESAKKYYVLDGYVTDHVILLQEHSKLFHYLAQFESDFKRKIAMESRRLEMLGPILRSLNIISFEVLHKQISYELGETALVLLDLKLDKLRSREEGTIEEKSLKKAEVLKVNDYARQALAYFAHFTFLYAQAKDRKPEHTVASLETLPLHELVDVFCSLPDESLVSEEEVRPFLNANFLSARVMSKIIVHASSLPASAPRASFLIACLHRYQFLQSFAPRICSKRGVSLEELFGEEFKIIEDMVKLLPSKIDRMCYLGETSLSL